MPDLSGLGADSLGLWTRPQARKLLTESQIDALVRTGVWQVPWRGVYADAGFVLGAEQRALAAVLASGGGQPFHYGPPDPKTGQRRRRVRAVACGRTAARVWAFPLIDDADPATGGLDHLLDDVAVWRHLPSLHSGERALRRHELTLRRANLVQLASGLWITSAVRTLVDCARLLSHEALVCALDDALHRELVSPAQLNLAVAGRRGATGGPALQLAVSLADGRAESPAETLARLILKPVLPGLQPQVRLFDAAARIVARFDLGDEAVRLAVEADGRAGHAGDPMVAKDRRRDRRTMAFGWWTERATWFDLRRRQDEFRLRVVTKDAELRADLGTAA